MMNFWPGFTLCFLPRFSMFQYCTLKVIEDEIVQSFSLDVLTAAFCMVFFLSLLFGLIEIWQNCLFWGERNRIRLWILAILWSLPLDLEVQDFSCISVSYLNECLFLFTSNTLRQHYCWLQALLKMHESKYKMLINFREKCFWSINVAHSQSMCLTGDLADHFIKLICHF